jgi:hypothetical protein
VTGDDERAESDTIAHEMPQHRRAFTITALNHLSPDGIDLCAPVAYPRMSGRRLKHYGFHACRRADHSTADPSADVAPSHSRVHGPDTCDLPSN